MGDRNPEAGSAMGLDGVVDFLRARTPSDQGRLAPPSRFRWQICGSRTLGTGGSGAARVLVDRALVSILEVVVGGFFCLFVEKAMATALD